MLRRGQIGFTLIELMIVVAIISVLAVVAGTAYRRYMDNGRTTEAYAMLGEIRNKEEAYRAEFSGYTGWSNGSEATSASVPQVDGTCSIGATEPCPKCAPGSTAPGCSLTNTYWSALGINAGKGYLQCGYILNYGAANTTVAGTLGSDILGTGTQATPWWYAVAVCDNDGKSTTNATFTTASTITTISAQNEHQ